METLLNILTACWHVLLESAPWMLLGFTVAGLLKALLPPDLVARHLGRSRFSNVLKASLLGAPIPLCSCGVIPAAAGLREQGASRGSTAAFLISTPETGVDSIAVTWALLDPVMTIFRPLAAIVTATLAGVGINLSNPDDGPPPPKQESCCSGCEGSVPQRAPVTVRVQGGLSYAFTNLLGDIGAWFLLGVFLAGLITGLVPAGFIENHLGTGLGSMLVMLLVSVPLYVCATSSTPIAAALALKGLSPGAALVLLLAGPATNVASLAVVQRILGRKATVIYLLAIVLCSLGLGLLANWIYGAFGLSVTGWIAPGEAHGYGWFEIATAIVLLALTLRAMSLEYFHPQHRTKEA